MRPPRAAPRPEAAQGVYGISVAAELVGMGTQTLRLYEARGLVDPERTEGGTRRYSADDLDRIRRIGDLLGSGLNLAGIRMVLDLEAQNAVLLKEKADHRWLSANARRSTRPPSQSVPTAGATRKRPR